MAMQGQGQGIDLPLLDDIIGRLLEVRSARPGKQVQLSEAEIRQLCVASREIFLKQPNLLELEAPIKICGKIPSLCSVSIEIKLSFEFYKKDHFFLAELNPVCCCFFNGFLKPCDTVVF